MIPDVVEDRRTDSAGNIYIRRYTKGKLLGKVSAARIRCHLSAHGCYCREWVVRVACCRQHGRSLACRLRLYCSCWTVGVRAGEALSELLPI